MFEVDFQHASSSALPPSFNFTTGLNLLHNFDAVVRLSPDCRGSKPIPPPKNASSTTKQASTKNKDLLGNPYAAVQYYEVEDDLPFMPKHLWSGGVKYQADFLPTADGCDITVHAPGGFTSTNHWRLVRENNAASTATSTIVNTSSIPEGDAAIVSKDLLHPDSGGGGWSVQIVSDARCNRTFVAIVKGFLRNSHQQLQLAFIEKVSEPVVVEQRPALGQRRPTLGRRRSSVF